jgi:branched-chain amino acid transport system permease protein
MLFWLTLEQVLNGILVGAYYTLLALGLSLIFSLGGVINLAHGGLYALGAYFMVELTGHLGYVPAFFLAPVAVALIGVLIEALLIRRLYREDPVLTLLLTFGLAIIIEQSIRLIWGATGLPFAIPDFLRGVLLVGDFIYPYYRMAILGLVAVVIVGIWLLLTRTSFGMVVRAGIADPDIVRAMGINLRPIQTSVFALGVGLAALAGVAAAPLAGVQPAMGIEIVTAAFVVVVIGGLGSFWGVVLAGLLVGVVRGLTVMVFPPATEASMYALMILILLLRPRGLMGEPMERLE